MAFKTINIIVADDHPVVLTGAVKLLESRADCKVVAAVRSITEMFSALKQSQCDVLISDFSFDGDSEPDGLLMLEKVTRLFPDVKVIVLSQHDDLVRVRRIMTSGGAGFVSKSSGIPALPFAIDAVLKGMKYVDPETSKLLIEHMFNGAGDHLAEEALTMREMEVMRLYARGMTVTKIANCTKRSIKTISAQKQSVMRKLGVDNDVELIGALKHIEVGA